jgi:hypothetical protein
MSDMPREGDPISLKDIEEIIDGIRRRKENFPDEPAHMSIIFVLMGIGRRYTPVSCANGEWNGHIWDLPAEEGIPVCPNGHVLTEGEGVTLGWVKAQ